ncbi:unnamed protein product [Rotaria sordida]|uniref:RING-type domain-containing protein n=1 Tax=Rotaria sordida TaxID=392033 RepID=A0A815BZ23_9BILA|nr:unnamed protein product [Rotaria sordida]CAF1276859.1 unnamed protein product [Rotaria sordida]
MKCHKCSFVFQDPFQLICGHRQCRSCIDNQEGTTIKCVDCQEETPRKDVWLDRGFQKQVEHELAQRLINDW